MRNWAWHGLFWGLLAGLAPAVNALDTATSLPSSLIRIGAMGSARAVHQTTLLSDGRLLISGGCGGESCSRTLASVELFDPVTRRFQPAAPLAEARSSHVAVRLDDGRVLVAGGWNGREATATAERYDPVSGRWTATGPMATPRSSPMLAKLPDGRVLIAGGGLGRQGVHRSAELYDPATGRFTALPAMRDNHYLATSLTDGRVLLSGGHAGREILSSAEIFDPGSKRFLPTGNLITPRVKHAATLLADGRVLIVGGSDQRDYQGRYASSEFFDPASGTFTAGPDLRAARHKIRDSVIRLPSGAVLITGSATRLELYRPERQSFVSLEGELSGPLMFATTSLFDNGEVLLLGGYDDHIRVTDAAWQLRIGR